MARLLNKIIFTICASLLLIFPAMAAKKKTQVTIPAKRVATVLPANVPFIVIPPFAVAFDLIRRTSCDPNVAVSLGKGDPGFDPAGPKTGNFLIPAIWERCQGRLMPR